MGLLFHTSSHQIDSVLRLWCCYCLFFGHRSLQCWFFHVILILGSPRGLFWLPRWKLPLSHALCFLFYSYPSIQSCLVYSYVLSGCVTWTAHQIVNTTRLGTFSVLFKAAASMPGTVLRIMCVSVAQSCPTLCDPVDCSLPGFSIHGILQARILEWVTISFSRGSSRPRDQTWVSCIAGRGFNLWATREDCSTAE